MNCAVYDIDNGLVFGMYDYNDCAAVYVATGKKFVDEALKSAASLRQHSPDLKVILHTDIDVQSPLFNQILTVKNPQYSFIDKTICFEGVTEKRLLFLDSDTYIAAPLLEVFDLLKRFDVVACHAPWRISWNKKTREPWQIEGIPEAFSEPNTGVIGFRNIPAVHQMFTRWRELYEKEKETGNGIMHDQPGFRQAIWESDLSFYVMPPEYNSRLIFPTFINGSVKILHARFPDMQHVAEKINSEEGHKIFDPYAKDVLTVSTFRKLGTGLRHLIFSLLK